MYSLKSEESQVIDYQTQQMRLFPALAATYAQIFGAKSFVRNLHKIKGETENFNKITQSDLAKVNSNEKRNLILVDELLILSNIVATRCFSRSESSRL
jgi:hypothetical protein